MDETKLKEFLENYAEILKTDIDISEDLPLSYFVNMPGGCVEISTNDGRRIIYVSIDEGGLPSMPVGPAAMTYGRLIVDLLNKLYEIKGEA